ncbi:MAG: type IV secretion system DNA-binding domain-containing protein [Patescibacteria group bacterium]|nr:type IV secretion system DNA-binding domain-containing protein [Patescibacteria group bacterium]MDD5715084.1 type IV secretion system DNA-binding domain-containing protein [Patescibacteria group bacterium]
MDNEIKDELTVFAKTNFRNLERRFGIKVDDRRRHMYLIGKTGMGKTTVLENMVIEDIRAGRGLALVDPHGDLVEKILDYIPSYRINDVVYVNPADLEYPIGFNVLESVNLDQRHLVASGLMGVFTKIWEGVWSARMEYILNNCILALLEYPGSTMLGISRILVDKKYRSKVVEKITDPIVKSFWIDEFAAYNERFRNEAIAPIQNKVGQFLSSAIIRNIVGQAKSTIDLRSLMDEGKILLLNLAKGRIGEASSALLGAMMITRLQLAAMSRVDIPEEKRRDFYLYVDEFQNFATESFANILSEARKYRLNLVIAHQYIEQLDETVQAAVFGNVGTIMCFRVGAGDAEFLAKEFFPTFTEEDLVNLTKYNVYMKLMIDGVASEPFSAATLPPLEGATNNRDKVIRVSRERYSKPRALIEDKITRWSGVQELYKATAEEDNRTLSSTPASYKAKPNAIHRNADRPVFRPKQQTIPPSTKPTKPVIPFRELETVPINEGGKSISLFEAIKTAPKPFQGGRPTKNHHAKKNSVIQRTTANNVTQQTHQRRPTDFGRLSSHTIPHILKPGKIEKIN